MERQAPEWHRWKPRIFGVVLCCLVLQAGLVYSDFDDADPGARVALGADAQAGQRIYRAHNCQACHQLYGFGGFLGPDLTNVTTRLPDERLTVLLDQGLGRMPAFHFSARERGELLAFLRAIDGSGQGTPQLATAATTELFTGLVAAYERDEAGSSGAAVLPDAPRRGLLLTQTYGCGACHRAFRTGLLGAPDLTLATRRRSADYIRETLRLGRGRMPAFGMDEERAGDVLALLGWIGERRGELADRWSTDRRVRAGAWSDIPWFTFPKSR